MMGDPLVVSFRVNKKAAWCGFPFCYPGEQAKVEIPPFYPDRARPYLSETEAKTLFDKIDTICRDTGAPLYPLMLFPTALMIAPALVWGLELPYAMQITIGAIVTIVVSIFGIVGTFLILGYKRKAQVTKLIEEWNKTEGVPKGLFIELGDNRGPSAENFWKSVYPRRFTISNGQQDTIVIDNNNDPMIHLYMNPSSRQEWCRQNGVPFDEHKVMSTFVTGPTTHIV